MKDALLFVREKLVTIASLGCEDTTKCEGYQPGFTRTSGFRWTCKICTPVKFAVIKIDEALKAGTKIRSEKGTAP